MDLIKLGPHRRVDPNQRVEAGVGHGRGKMLNGGIQVNLGKTLQRRVQ